MDSSYTEPLEWSTGDVCGVDNCPSIRYIENADGSRSCEYGHVKQEVLYAEEEYIDPGGRTTSKKKEKVEVRKGNFRSGCWNY
jgi:hypothetical protein